MMKKAKKLKIMNKEGWTWLWNVKKWHYFREGRSLCGKYLLMGSGELDQGNDNSPSNCKSCCKKLLKAKHTKTLI